MLHQSLGSMIGVGSMAVTLRNQKVEALIREIGRETGEGPSAVIARAVQEAADQLKAEKAKRRAEKLARMRAARARLPTFSDADRAAVQEDLRTMHDYLYEDEPKP
jgi:hypothetical protein